MILIPRKVSYVRARAGALPLHPAKEPKVPWILLSATALLVRDFVLLRRRRWALPRPAKEPKVPWILLVATALLVPSLVQRRGLRWALPRPAKEPKVPWILLPATALLVRSLVQRRRRAESYPYTLSPIPSSEQSAPSRHPKVAGEVDWQSRPHRSHSAEPAPTPSVPVPRPPRSPSVP